MLLSYAAKLCCEAMLRSTVQYGFERQPAGHVNEGDQCSGVLRAGSREMQKKSIATGSVNLFQGQFWCLLLAGRFNEVGASHQLISIRHDILIE